MVVCVISALIVIIKCETSHDIYEDYQYSDEAENLPGKNVFAYEKSDDDNQWSFYLKMRSGSRPA